MTEQEPINIPDNTVWFEGKPYRWDWCAKRGCDNRACLRLESKFCYPHSNSPKDKIIRELEKHRETVS